MRRTNFAFLLFILLSFFTPLAASVPFSASVTPSILNATKAITLNFTITNLGNTNITQVNITLPEKLEYLLEISAGTTAENVDYTPISWSNTTKEGFIENGSQEYFWFGVKAVDIGKFNITIKTVDKNGKSNSTYVEVNVQDVDAPQWDNNSTAPKSSVYGETVYFGIEWKDNIQLSQIIFELDQTKNYTYNVSGKVLSMNISIDSTQLSAGTHYYRWYAKDTSNNWNSTQLLTYLVEKAPNIINVYLNGILNKNITITTESSLNITATGKGNVSIYYNNTLLELDEDSATYILPKGILDVGKYLFKANATGNQNYTTNSTGATYAVKVIYPPPKWKNIATSPSSGTSYEKNAEYKFSITWYIENSPNNISTVIFEFNGTNHTVTQFTGNSTHATYTFTKKDLAAGNYTYRWFANDTDNQFNVTPMQTFIIKKAVPLLILDAKSWEIIAGEKNYVNCTCPQNLTVNLYRNGILVNNPDTQILDEGSYLYICNVSETQNYTSRSIEKILKVKAKPFADFEFVEIPLIVLARQNETTSIKIGIKNTGNVEQNVKMEIKDIAIGIISIYPQTQLIKPGEEKVYQINFTLNFPQIRDYKGRIVATSPNKTIEEEFVLRVIPTEEKEEEIIRELEKIGKEFTDLESEIKELKKRGINTTNIEEILNKLKDDWERAESSIAKKDYFTAYQILQELKSGVEEVKSKIAEMKERPIWETISKYWIYFAIVLIAIAIGLIIYMLIPPKAEYKPEKKEFIWRPRKSWKEKLKEMIEKFKLIKK